MGCGAGLVLAALIWGGHQSIAGVIVPMFFFAMGFSIARPPAMAAALSPYPHMAGLASAFLGFMQMSLGGLAAVVFGALYDGTPRPMAAGVAASGLLALLVFLALSPRGESHGVD